MAQPSHIAPEKGGNIARLRVGQTKPRDPLVAVWALRQAMLKLGCRTSAKERFASTRIGVGRGFPTV